MNFTPVWTDGSEQEWHQAVERYWDYVTPANMKLEQEMAQLDGRQPA